MAKRVVVRAIGGGWARRGPALGVVHRAPR
jgi:hypothetical protein